MSDELTTFDIKILEQIQRDASLSTGELADKIGLSQSPCWRRLQRLKDEGYISRQVALLDRTKFKQSFVIFASLKMATLTEEKREDFLRMIAITPEIMECHSVLGEMDLLLKVLASSLQWYQTFIFRVLLKLPGVQDVQSTVTLTELKYETAIPVRGNLAL
ncbi:Lrp/AsnC family transcriptional regulator [Sphingomonas carotinifaciens]|uniref:Transcriptional regulator, AsnC family n=1 Tax=Sphingomonas carotinifaciens TaxID=1166323 RepID=A0A1G7Q099_9SPHN|nr:Lrp/AsnC family transcriptional regulator [Sphingomonas carotinifaciens]MBB4087580.1 Lrp/AsnC family transcriptional regulator [Sphingomonas carotinifaciens]MWC45664.1 winged helix-turn-helix transcriptional regulator [Sphingomonas carotinifaciens]SDF91888.1 transcriptional regulator, AsnC family [Sphingomonas carotinifaciens]